MKKEDFVIRKIGSLWVMDVIGFTGEPFVVVSGSRTMLEDLKYYCLIHDVRCFEDMTSRFGDCFVFVH